MTYLIEYHNGLGWCAVGHRSSLDQASTYFFELLNRKDI